MPRDVTHITCTLNNGIHFVTTPECQLAENTPIEQEFELYVLASFLELSYSLPPLALNTASWSSL